ncbi:hypothetical protein ACQP1G_17160 [Nocardia sp. CA-107356]|uniref:HNH endonuclease n=1 Tax=Nocardia sp. CA-107356 TaxID=3239972 RepID=UPI003D901FCA
MVADQDPGPEIPITVPQVYRRYRAVLVTERGPRRGLRAAPDRDDERPPVEAHWGRISLARDIAPRPLDDDPIRIWNSRRSELVQRLLAEACERCDSTHKVEVHYVRALKDLNPKGRKPQPDWVEQMAARRRKTLVVCRTCHEDIHAGRPTGRPR